jgi:hypothetical protein
MIPVRTDWDVRVTDVIHCSSLPVLLIACTRRNYESSYTPNEISVFLLHAPKNVIPYAGSALRIYRIRQGNLTVADLS